MTRSIDTESNSEVFPLIENPQCINKIQNSHQGLWSDLAERRELHVISSNRNKWLALLFGQFIAVVATSQNAASFTLEYGMKKVFPMFLMFHAYVILALHLLFNLNLKDVEAPHRVPFTSIRLRAPCWYYLCLSIFDVGPNYLTLISLKNTSLTSATLLGSLTVPSTMLVCKFLLAKVYGPQHYLGVVLCMMGGFLTVWADFDRGNDQQDSSSQHPHSYYGDILAILAALLYGIGDAAGEFWSKHVDRKEYLGMLGLFGSIFTLVLSPLFEWDAVCDLFADKESFMPAFGIICIYVPLLVAYYVSSTIFLMSSDATLLNLSLQSSNLWAIVFSIAAFRESPSPLFYLSVILVVSGVFVYELLGNTTKEMGSESGPSPARNKSSDYQSINNENII